MKARLYILVLLLVIGWSSCPAYYLSPLYAGGSKVHG